MKSLLEEKENKREKKTQNKFLHIKSKSKKIRIAAIENLIKTGAFIAALSMSVSGFAAPSDDGVSPILFQGTPTKADVVRECKLPNVKRANSPTEYIITNPANQSGQIYTVPIGNPTDYTYAISISLQNKILSFSDVSDQYNDSNPNNFQLYDAPGVEAVVMQSSSSANIYCYVNNVSDSNLTLASGNSVTKVAVYWSMGSCPLEKDTLEQVCMAYGEAAYPSNAKITLQARQRVHYGSEQSLQPISLCGCGGDAPETPRLCNPAIAAGTPSSPKLESCNPNGEPLNGLNSTSVGTGGSQTCITYNIGGQWYKSGC